MNVRTQALTLLFAFALLLFTRSALSEETRPKIQKWPPTLEELVRDAEAADVPSVCDLSIVEKGDVLAAVVKYDREKTAKYNEAFLRSPEDRRVEMCYFYLLRAYYFSADGDFLGLQQQFTESGSSLNAGTKLLHFTRHPAGTKVVFVELEDWLVRGMPKKDWYTPTYYHFTTMYPEKKKVLVDAFTVAPR